MKQLLQLVRASACAIGLLLAATPAAFGHELAGVPHAHAGDLASALSSAAGPASSLFAWLVPFALVAAAFALRAAPQLRRAAARAA